MSSPIDKIEARRASVVSFLSWRRHSDLGLKFSLDQRSFAFVNATLCRLLLRKALSIAQSNYPRRVNEPV